MSTTHFYYDHMLFVFRPIFDINSDHLITNANSRKTPQFQFNKSIRPSEKLYTQSSLSAQQRLTSLQFRND